MPKLVDLNKMYDSMFMGPKPTAAETAKAAYESRYQSMLDARRQNAEQARTDAVKMARYNALGNLLTTMVQPLGWAAGGRGAAAGNYQPYDSRQYIDAYSRAAKATDDVRNVGLEEEAWRVKLAEDDYERQLALEDEARKRENKVQDEARALEIWSEKERKKQEYRVDYLDRQTEARKEVDDNKAGNRTSGSSGSLSVEDRLRLKDHDAWLRYKDRQIAKGEPYDDFETWRKGGSSSGGSKKEEGGAKPSAPSKPGQPSKPSNGSKSIGWGTPSSGKRQSSGSSKHIGW